MWTNKWVKTMGMDKNKIENAAVLAIKNKVA